MAKKRNLVDLIRHATQPRFRADEKIRIVLERLRDEITKKPFAGLRPGRNRAVWVLFFAVYFALPLLGRGQDVPSDPAPEKTWRIGVLFWHDSPNDETTFEGIQEALKVTGRRYELIVKQAKEDRKEAVRILEAYKRDRLDLIFAMGTQAALQAAEVVNDIPVVFTAVTNHVDSGVVSSWDGSGRNLAGNSNWIESKTKLRVFRLAVPDLTRLGLLRSKKQDVITAAELRDMRKYLGRSDMPKIEIKEEVVEGIEDIQPAIERLVGQRVQAIWIPIDKLIYENMNRTLKAVQPHGIPLVSTSLKGAKAGAVASVVVDYVMLGKRAVLIALDILDRGMNPGKIPVGTMKGYHVIVNLEAARRCNFEPPLSLLVLADSILEDVIAPGEEENDNKHQ